MSALLRAFSHLEVDQTPEQLAAPGSAVGFLLSSRSHDHPLVVVTASSRRASELKDEIDTYLGAGSVIELPPWETLPHEKLSPKSDTVAQRMKVLSSLGEQRVIVTSIRALIQPIAPLETTLISLELEAEISMEHLIAHLVLLGFQRTDLVERRGDHSLSILAAKCC